jgi:hypothetical protein
MADIFEPVVNQLISLGFLNALMLFFFAVILYAVLKKSHILGDSNILNAIISFIAAFFVFVFPFITGTSLIPNFSMFFTQTVVILLFLIMGFIMASLFYPDMPAFLAEHFTHRSIISVFIALGIALFIISGLVTSFFASFSSPKLATGGPGPSSDVLIIAAGLIIFVVVLIVASSTVRSES